MDDAALVEAVAARYVRQMGSEAVRYLREMQELAASLSDEDSAQAWCDIADATQAILLAPISDPTSREDRSRSASPFPAFAN